MIEDVVILRSTAPLTTLGIMPKSDPESLFSLLKINGWRVKIVEPWGASNEPPLFKQLR